MEIDQQKFDCYNTEVSCFIISNLNWLWQLQTGKGASVEKIQFARINDGILVYDHGESDSTVYTGLN